ncbi:C39 family peptidase [Williamsia sp.]|uniref:C39 family peptidase n=1 Tax=Williamsia sp. TaxID=1872085 RepID=UPI002F9203DF
MDGDVTLPINFGIIKQDTPYWCGPATTQMILSARGVSVGEQQLARELGTTTNGTNHVGLIADRLNAWLGDFWVRRDIADPASPAATEKLWADIQHSILAGYGVACNVDVSPGNYPRPTRGERLSYGGGRVLHYFAAMGFNARTREVLVPDSGFPDYLYWMSVDQLATCIAAKGYAAAVNAPIVDEIDAPAVIDFIRKFCGPLISDTKDIREQFCGMGSRDAGQYAGWPQLGKNDLGLNQTMVDAISDLRIGA